MWMTVIRWINYLAQLMRYPIWTLRDPLSEEMICTGNSCLPKPPCQLQWDRISEGSSRIPHFQRGWERTARWIRTAAWRKRSSCTLPSLLIRCYVLFSWYFKMMLLGILWCSTGLHSFSEVHVASAIVTRWSGRCWESGISAGRVWLQSRWLYGNVERITV